MYSKVIPNISKPAETLLSSDSSVCAIICDFNKCDFNNKLKFFLSHLSVFIVRPPILLVNGHPGVPALHDLRHGGKVEKGRAGQHETVL